MAIPAQAQDMTIRRGDTWASTKFQTFEESISDVWSPGYRPTIEEVYEAISNGQLTPINLRQYEISSDVKVGGPGGDLWFILSDYIKFDITGEVMWFEMTAEQTSELYELFPSSPPFVGQYDIQFCLDGVVNTNITGNINLVEDITERDPCGNI